MFDGLLESIDGVPVVVSFDETVEFARGVEAAAGGCEEAGERKPAVLPMLTVDSVPVLDE